MRMQLFLLRSNKWWVGSPLNVNDCRYKKENSSIAIQKRSVLFRIHTFAVYQYIENKQLVYLLHMVPYFPEYMIILYI